MASLLPALLLAAVLALPLRGAARRGAVAAACAAALVVFAWRFAIVPEDTFISMRYARHLVEGHGLVYNPGELPRVEGYTNLLWTLVLAAAHAVHAPPLGAAVVLSVAAGAAVVVLLASAAPRLFGDAEAVPMSAAALVLLPAYWDAAGSGLETAMYAALVTWAALAQMLALREGRVPGLGAAVPLALAVLTRPEGIYVAGLLCGAAALVVRADRAALRRQAALFAVALGVFVAHLLARRAYYGEWLPNTFHCKVGATGAQVRRGVEQFLQLLRTGNGLLLVPCVAAPWLLRRAPWLAPPLALGAGYTAYVVFVGGDNFWRHRYLVPVLPALLLVSEAVVRLVASASLATLPRGARAALAAAGVIALWGSVDGLKLTPHRDALDARFAGDRDLGAWLTEHTPEGRSVAVFAAGVVPYYTRRGVIDMLGLCDHHIARVAPPAGAGARNAGHEKYDFDYVLARDPEFVLLEWPDPADPYSHVAAAMRADPTLRARFEERYEAVTVDVNGRTWRLLRRRR